MIQFSNALPLNVMHADPINQPILDHFRSTMSSLASFIKKRIPSSKDDSHGTSSPSVEKDAKSTTPDVDSNQNLQPPSVKEEPNPTQPSSLRGKLKDALTKTRERIQSAFDHPLEASCANPSDCVQLLKEPSVANYTACNRQLKKCDSEWIELFLHADGLQVSQIL